MDTDAKEFSVKKIREDIEAEKSRLLDLIDSNAAQFESVIRSFDKLSVMRVAVDGDTLDVNFTGDRFALQAAWGNLRRLGFNTTSKAESGKSGYNGFWDHEESDARLWISFTSSKCRTVQIGTKMVEQPIYETVCDETGVEA